MVEVELANAEGGKTGNSKPVLIQDLQRKKSILVLHIAELRTELGNVKLSSAGSGYEQVDGIDYSSLVEKFIDDKEILDLIPKVVLRSLI